MLVAWIWAAVVSKPLNVPHLVATLLACQFQSIIALQCAIKTLCSLEICDHKICEYISTLSAIGSRGKVDDCLTWSVDYWTCGLCEVIALSNDSPKIFKSGDIISRNVFTDFVFTDFETPSSFYNDHERSFKSEV